MNERLFLYRIEKRKGKKGLLYAKLTFAFNETAEQVCAQASAHCI